MGHHRNGTSEFLLDFWEIATIYFDPQIFVKTCNRIS